MKRKVNPYWAEQIPPQAGEQESKEMWRCGCDRCEYRVDFWARDDAEKAAHGHNATAHGGKPKAKVYVASSWSRFFDYIKDSE